MHKRKKPYKSTVTFRLFPNLVDWLARESARLGKTKTRLVEEAIRLKMAFKDPA